MTNGVNTRGHSHAPSATYDEDADDADSDKSDPDIDIYYSTSNNGLTPVVHSQFSQLRDIKGPKGGVSHMLPLWKQFFIPVGPDGLYLPQQKFIWIWHVISSIWIIISCFVQAIAMSFQINSTWVYVFLYFSDVMYILEVILNFNLAYTSKRGMLVVSKRAVRMKYFKSQFFPDLITLLPLEIFALTKLDHNNILVFTMQLRGNRLIRYYKPIFNIGKRESELGHNALLDALLKYFLVCAIATHLMACIWFQFACNMFVSPPTCYNQSWALSNDYFMMRDYKVTVNMSTFDAYIISLYWAMATATSTGYGDISAIYLWEKFFSIVAMLAGIGIYFGMLLGGLTSMLTNLDKNRARFVHRFNVVQDEIQQVDCVDVLRDQVIGYYEHIWVRKKAQASFEELFRNLPFTIRGELAMAAYQCILEEAHLFDGCPKGFMRMLYMCIKPKLFLPEQIVVMRGDVGHEMYFIQTGVLHVLSEEDDDTPIATLNRGKMFGEISLMLSVPRTVTIRAATHCDIMVLERHDLQTVFHQYPTVMIHLQNVARKRCNTANDIVSKEHSNTLEKHFDAFKRRSSAFVAGPTNMSRRKFFSPSLMSIGSNSRRTTLAITEKNCSNEDGVLSAHSIAMMVPSSEASIHRSIRIRRKSNFLGGRGSIFNNDKIFNEKQQMPTISMDVGYDVVQKRLRGHVDKGKKRCTKLRTSSQDIMNKFSNKTIPPDSSLLKLWKLIIMCTVIIMSVTYPYQAAFAPQEDTLNNSQSTLAITVVILTYAGNFLFLLDIVVNLRTGIATPHDTLTEFKDITCHYCHTWKFVNDVAAVVPLESLRLVIHSSASSFYPLLHFNRIIKIIEVPNWFRQLEKSIYVNVYNTRCAKCVLYTLLATHWTACIMFYNACPGYADHCGENSWYTNVLHARSKIAKSNNETSDYVISMYFAVATMTSTGYGDINGTTNSDRIICLSAMLVGLLLYGYSLAVIAATITNLDSFRVGYQEKLFGVKEFFEEQDVPKYLKEQVFNHMSMMWERYRGEWHPSSRKLMYDIPMGLQQDIIMDDMETIIRNTPIFRDLDNSFLRLVCNKIEPYMYAPGDVIVYAGVLCRESCFVRRGICQIISPHDIFLTEIGPGQYFGVISMLFGQYQKSSLIAKTHVEILQLTLHDFNESLADFPLLAEQMRKMRRNTEGLKKAQFQMLTNMDIQEKKTVAEGNVPNIASRYSNTGITFTKGKPQNMVVFKKKNEDGTRNEDYWVPFQEGNKMVRLLRIILMKRAFIPESTLVNTWAWFLFVLSLLLSISIPLQMAFLYNNTFLWVVHIAIDAFFWINIYVSLHMAFLDMEGVLITHPLPCAIHYLKHNFVLDLLSVLPIELIWISMHNEDDILDVHLISLMRLNRILVCYRIPYVFSNFENNIQKATGTIRAIKFLLFMIIFENALTCILFFETCIPHHFHNQGYNDRSFETIGIHWCLPHSWLTRALEKKNLIMYKDCTWMLYCISLYWATATTISVGYGDIVATTNDEMLVTATAMILGTFFFGYIVASVASSLANADTLRSQYQDKMLAIENYMKYQGVPKQLQMRVYMHYEHVWQRTRSMDPKTLLSGMPLSIWGDVSLNLYKDILSKISWFQNVGDNFIMGLSKCLKPMLILKGESIFQKHDVGNEVYFIHRGIIDVFTETSMMIVRMDVLHEGQCFGEDAWLFNTPRPVTLMARVNCDLFVLSKNDLDSVLECYPTISQRMRKAAVEAHSIAKRHSINAKTYVPNMHFGGNRMDLDSNAKVVTRNRSYVPPADRMFMPSKSAELDIPLVPKKDLNLPAQPQDNHDMDHTPTASQCLARRSATQANGNTNSTDSLKSDQQHRRGQGNDESTDQQLEDINQNARTDEQSEAENEAESEAANAAESEAVNEAESEAANAAEGEEPNYELRFSEGQLNLTSQDIEDFLEFSQYGWWRGLVYEDEKYRIDQLNRTLEKWKKNSLSNASQSNDNENCGNEDDNHSNKNENKNDDVNHGNKNDDNSHVVSQSNDVIHPCDVNVNLDKNNNSGTDIVNQNVKSVKNGAAGAEGGVGGGTVADVKKSSHGGMIEQERIRKSISQISKGKEDEIDESFHPTIISHSGISLFSNSAQVEAESLIQTTKEEVPIDEGTKSDLNKQRSITYKDEEEPGSARGNNSEVLDYPSSVTMGSRTDASVSVPSEKSKMSSLFTARRTSTVKPSTYSLYNKGAIGPPNCCNRQQSMMDLYYRFIQMNRFTIKFDDRCLLIFRDIMCFFNFFSILLIIFQAAFHEGHPLLLCLSYLIDGVMFIDMYVKFRITFVNQNGQIVQHFNVLFLKYLKSKTGFVVDITCALPIEIFAVFASPEHRVVVLLYLRLWKILRLFRLLEYFYYWEQELNINVLFVRFCKFFVVFTLVTHTLSCIWYMFACPLSTCKADSWVTYNLIHEEGELYVTTVYFTLATMTSTGYGDVSAHNFLEMLYASFIMIVGKLLFGFILANITATLSNTGEYRVRFDLQIQSVRSDMKEQNVPAYLHNRVVNYFNYLWMRNKGKDQHHLLSDCPTCLRAEVNLSITRPMLDTIELFESVTESFLRHISQHVVPVLFMPGDYIVKTGDIGKHVYYIQKGEVDVIDESTHHITSVLKKGAVFGEVSLVGNMPRRITVRAVTHVDIYSLSKKSVDSVLHFYPDMRRLLGFRAHERFGRLFKHCGINIDMKID